MDRLGLLPGLGRGLARTCVACRLPLSLELERYPHVCATPELLAFTYRQPANSRSPGYPLRVHDLVHLSLGDRGNREPQRSFLHTCVRDALELAYRGDV